MQTIGVYDSTLQGLPWAEVLRSWTSIGQLLVVLVSRSWTVRLCTCSYQHRMHTQMTSWEVSTHTPRACIVQSLRCELMFDTAGRAEDQWETTAEMTSPNPSAYRWYPRSAEPHLHAGKAARRQGCTRAASSKKPSNNGLRTSAADKSTCRTPQEPLYHPPVDRYKEQRYTHAPL
jgi:hypothetical protein